MDKVNTLECKHAVTSTAKYRELVRKALLADRFTLEDFPILSKLPIIEQWAATHSHQVLPRARALETLLRAAVNDVLHALEDARDKPSRRMAHFIQRRYQDQATVTAIAAEFGIAATSVHRGVAHRALDLITRRFLQLAEGTALRAAQQAPAGAPHTKAS